MKAPELLENILQQLPFPPTQLQYGLITGLADFVAEGAPYEVYLLNGYAGSGKTSVVGALVRALNAMKQKCVVLAPTGRAAKVASNLSGGQASTIHRRIYRPDSPEPGAKYMIAPNRSRDTLFIVDEASLITDSAATSQSLLAQLVRYVYSGEGCRMLLLGDIAQLPPVGQSEAPAMKPERLRQLGLHPIQFTLDEVIRQQAESGILYNATMAREMLLHPDAGLKPRITSRGFDDVKVISMRDLADELSTSYATVGQDDTIIITRSNKRANQYNMAIRNMVMMAEEPLQQGDRLVISRNDYYWSEINQLGSLIANGDMAEVAWVGRREKMYGRWFADVELIFPPSETRVGAKLMLRSLMTDGPGVPQEEMESLYAKVYAEKEMQEEGTMTSRIKDALSDPYYNALHAKYGYCVTCHKAQGGQWKHVYIDIGGLPPDGLDATFWRWLYTAITRATEKVWFVK